MTPTSDAPILVIGATGKTGRRVAERLQARGLPVRAGSRSADPPFDWDDRATWAPALRGTHAAYVSFYPDIAVPGTAEVIGELARTAHLGGTRRLVLLSGRGETEAQRAERALAESGVTWTVLRCSWFMQNFSESFFAEPVAAGELALPAGEVPVPFVDVEDIADVAVAALTEDGHAGRVYELSGPQALTHADVVAEISRATGREIRYEDVPLDAFAAGLAEADVPEDVIGLLSYLFTEVLVEANSGVTDGVREALGRPPRDFASFARDAAATGVWSRSLAT